MVTRTFKRDLVFVKRDLVCVKRDLLYVKRDLTCVKRDLECVKDGAPRDIRKNVPITLVINKKKISLTTVRVTQTQLY